MSLRGTAIGRVNSKQLTKQLAIVKLPIFLNIVKQGRTDIQIIDGGIEKHYFGPKQRHPTLSPIPRFSFLTWAIVLNWPENPPGGEEMRIAEKSLKGLKTHTDGVCDML